MSACFAYGLAAGKPIGEIAKTELLSRGGSDIWQNLPVLIVVMLGGFTTNFHLVYCAAGEEPFGEPVFWRAGAGGRQNILDQDFDANGRMRGAGGKENRWPRNLAGG
jgi:hypothetical protein